MPADRLASLKLAPWHLYVAASLVAVAVHGFFVESGSLTQSFVYDGIGAAAVARRPGRRLAPSTGPDRAMAPDGLRPGPVRRR